MTLLSTSGWARPVRRDVPVRKHHLSDAVVVVVVVVVVKWWCRESTYKLSQSLPLFIIHVWHQLQTLLIFEKMHNSWFSTKWLHDFLQRQQESFGFLLLSTSSCVFGVFTIVCDAPTLILIPPWFLIPSLSVLRAGKVEVSVEHKVLWNEVVNKKDVKRNLLAFLGLPGIMCAERRLSEKGVFEQWRRDCATVARLN